MSFTGSSVSEWIHTGRQVVQLSAGKSLTNKTITGMGEIMFCKMNNYAFYVSYIWIFRMFYSLSYLVLFKYELVLTFVTIWPSMYLCMSFFVIFFI